MLYCITYWQVRFDYKRVETLIEAALEELLKGRKYVAPDCKWLAQDLSADLLERVKTDQRDAGLRRYKFVVVVNVGSVVENPDLQLASRCLWTCCREPRPAAGQPLPLDAQHGRVRQRLLLQ